MFQQWLFMDKQSVFCSSDAVYNSADQVQAEAGRMGPASQGPVAPDSNINMY